MITGLYGGFLTFLYLKLSLAVIFARRKHQVAYGMGRDGELSREVTAASNFLSYVPLFLVLLLAVVGRPSTPAWLVHGLAAPFALGRALHAFSVLSREREKDFRFRVAGMHLTIWPLAALAATHVGLYFQSLAE